MNRESRVRGIYCFDGKIYYWSDLTTRSAHLRYRARDRRYVWAILARALDAYEIYYVTFIAIKNARYRSWILFTYLDTETAWQCARLDLAMHHDVLLEKERGGHRATQLSSPLSSKRLSSCLSLLNSFCRNVPSNVPHYSCNRTKKNENENEVRDEKKTLAKGGNERRRQTDRYQR